MFLTETFRAAISFGGAMARRGGGVIAFLAVLQAEPLLGQQRVITLAEAIRRSERVQPDVIRAAADVRTAGARRRSSGRR